MTTMTVPAGAVEAPACGRPDAPTARLILPAGAPEAEWHAVRAAGIGGSDVAAILGLDPYRGPRHVYEAKHGRGDTRDTQPMRWGRRLEALIAEAFTEETALTTIETPGTFAHVDRPWQLANVDRFILDDDGAVVAPLECKNRSEYQADDWEEGVPDSPAIQAHWYMATCGWSHAWVAALIGGNRLRKYRLDRDEEIVTWLVDHCGRWYQDHVVDGFPPPADGLKATADLLSKLWDVRTDEVVNVDLDRAVELREKRAALKGQEKAVAAELRTVENEMRLMTGEAEVARVGSKSAWTWKQNGTFASSRFREEQPELAAAYTRQVEAVDTDRLAAEHPETYRTYRARVLRVPAKGL
ncbi:lambda-exonuclease family protein [Streptomyces diacarni]|uniref:YqaJ viral recombinase family nuclease n=1 Tax=Streptomyces diacarni TaxID=2800381 RepID=UPI0033C16D1C